MNDTRICILGGSGFVGGHLVGLLTEHGLNVRVLTRSKERHRDLLVLPNIELVQSDVYDAEELTAQFADHDAVINLVGILNEKGHDGRGFQRAHVELAEKVVAACKTAGVKRLLHMSALGADARTGPSHYLRSKGEAEDLVHAAATENFHVTSFRPSLIFGPDDSLFNRFATLMKLAPFIFPLAAPDGRFAPVYVGDVVEAFYRALNKKETFGQRYDLCGPNVYTLKQLVEYTAKCTQSRRLVIGLNPTLSTLQARILEHLPGKPMSMDNYRSLQVSSTCTNNGLLAFDIAPTSVEAIVPKYLARYQPGGH